MWVHVYVGACGAAPRALCLGQRKMRMTHTGQFMHSMDDLSRLVSGPTAEEEPEGESGSVGEDVSPGSTKKLRSVCVCVPWGGTSGSLAGERDEGGRAERDGGGKLEGERQWRSACLRDLRETMLASIACLRL